MVRDHKPAKARAQYMYGDRVKFHGRPAVVVEVVPPGGRPKSKVSVTTLRADESYVIRAPIPPGAAKAIRRRDGEKAEYLTWPLTAQLAPLE